MNNNFEGILYRVVVMTKECVQKSGENVQKRMKIEQTLLSYYDQQEETVE